MISEDRKRHEQAREQGRSARRAGKRKDTNPYSRSASLRDLATEWDVGFNEVEAERGRR